METKNYIVIGAGLSGLTIARILAESGKKVTVFEKRDTIGGNVYDYEDKNGIIVQPYGPHIFHTNIKEVFDFLSQYTEWEKYEHRVKANIHGKLVPVPFNLTSLYKLYPQETADRIKDILIKEIGYGQKVPILQLKKHNDIDIREFADFVYKNIFYTYTKKQWGFKPEELGESVMNRVPVYLSEEDRYFTDEFQYMPKYGFTKMCENIANHKNIEIIYGKESCEILELKDNKIFVDGKEYNGTVIYTGCVDELFSYQLGRLPYRSLEFVIQTKNTSSYQEAPVVNYTVDKRYTRISEFSKFACKIKEKTVIMKEYSKEYTGDDDIPYYPIPREENFLLYEKYDKLASGYKNLFLLGRLANYKYINIDIAVKNAIELGKELLNKTK